MKTLLKFVRSKSVPELNDPLIANASRRFHARTDDASGTLVAVLKKCKTESNIGLTISGGIDKDAKPMVANLRPGGLAQRSGYFCVGDTILEINNQDVTSLTHGEMINLVKNSGKLLSFKIQCLPSLAKMKGRQVRTAELQCLALENGVRGFQFQGGSSADGLVKRPVVVTRVTQGSDPERGDSEPTNGLDFLCEHDQILAINSCTVDGLTTEQVTSILDSVDEEYQLKVRFSTRKQDSKALADGSLFAFVQRRSCDVSIGISLDVDFDREASGSIIMVSAVQSGSPADRTGVISRGDLLLRMGDISMDRLSLVDAISAMHRLPKDFDIHLVSNGGLTSRSSPEARDVMMSSSAYSTTPRGQTLPSNGFSTVNNSCRCYDRGTMHTCGSFNGRYMSRDIKRFGSAGRQRMFPSGTTNHRVHESQFRKPMETGVSLGSSFTSCCSSALSCQRIRPCPTPRHSTKSGVFTLTVCCRTGDLDFDVIDRTCCSNGGCLVITGVDPDSETGRSGQVLPGDRLLSIDGGCCRDLKEASCFDEMLNGLNGAVTTLGFEFDICDDVVPTSGTFIAKLMRLPCGLGIELGASISKTGSNRLRIKIVLPGSAASRMGLLNPGDQLLQINGRTFSHGMLTEAYALLNEADGMVVLKIRRDEVALLPSFVVELCEDGGELGVIISGSDQDPFGAICVAELMASGIASRSGAIFVGDRLLAVDSVSLRGKLLSDARRLLTDSRETIKLTLARVLYKDLHESPTSSNCGHFETDSLMQQPNPDSVSGSQDCTEVQPQKINNAPSVVDLQELYSTQSTGSDSQYYDGVYKKDGAVVSDDESDTRKGLQNSQTVYKTMVEDASMKNNKAVISDESLYNGKRTNLVSSPFTPIFNLSSMPTGRSLDPDSVLGVKPLPREVRLGGASVHRIKKCNLLRSPNESSKTETGLLGNVARQLPGLQSECHKPCDDLRVCPPVSLIAVRLSRCSMQDAYGFRIAAGIDRSGTYVESIQNGTAEQLRCHDRIVQVNGTTVEDFSCQRIVILLQESGLNLDMIVERLA